MAGAAPGSGPGLEGLCVHHAIPVAKPREPLWILMALIRATLEIPIMHGYDIAVLFHSDAAELIAIS